MEERAARADAIEASAWKAMYRAAPRGVTDALGLRALDVAGAAVFLAPHIPIGQFNRAIGMCGARPPSDEAVEAVIDEARRARASTLWIQACEGSALAALLASRGTVLAPRRAWAKMLHEGPLPEIASALRVEPIADDNGAELARVLVTAHAMPPPLAPWIEAMVSHEGFRAYGAFDDGKLVAGGFLHVGTEGAWLGLGGTLPSHRQRGAQGALMVRRVADARALGCEAIATETGEPVASEPNPSLANMRRCGFVQVSSRLNFVVL